jgi:hypothetical protein
MSASSDNPAATVGAITPVGTPPSQQYTFNVNTSVVRVITQANITASVNIPAANYNFASPPEPLIIQGGLFSLVLSQNSIFVGDSATATVSLSCTALDDIVLALSTSNPAAVSLSAASLTIKAGQPSTTFQVTGISAATGVKITASQTGLPSQSDTLTINSRPKKDKDDKSSHKDNKDDKDASDGPKLGGHEVSLPQRFWIGDFPPDELETGDLAAMIRLLARRLDEVEERVAASRAFIRVEERPPVGLNAFDDSQSDSDSGANADADGETDSDGSGDRRS